MEKSEGVVEKVKKSPLLTDLYISALFVAVGIVSQSSTNVLIASMAGVSIGFGFGYAVHSIKADRTAKA